MSTINIGVAGIYRADRSRTIEYAQVAKNAEKAVRLYTACTRNAAIRRCANSIRCLGTGMQSSSTFTAQLAAQKRH